MYLVKRENERAEFCAAAKWSLVKYDVGSRA